MGAMMADCGRQSVAFSRVVALSLCVVGGAVAADWPCYRGDSARTAVAGESLGFPLTLSWTYEPSQPPQPAWPDPLFEPHRLLFDYCFEPVIAGGIVCFGSSADNTIRALKADTGEMLWRYTTGGPIRFAPAICEGKAYVGSDDGLLYCLNAQTGKLLWRFRAGPNNRRVVGNERMISRWPLRCGVLVDNGVAYTVGGTWPAEGVYVYALDAESGEVVWCNDTSAHMYMTQPHDGAYALTGVAPQGYLAASSDRLLVATGRGVPAVYDRTTGELLFYNLQGRKGGSWTAVDEKNRLFHCGEGVNTLSYSLDTGEKAKAASFLPFRSLESGSNVVMIKHGDVVAYTKDEKDGSGTSGPAPVRKPPIWHWDVERGAQGLAVAAGRLFVAMTNGAIHCFVSGDEGIDGLPAAGETSARSGEAKQTERVSTLPKPATGKDDDFGEVLELTRKYAVTRGFALVLEPESSGLAEALAIGTELRVLKPLSAPGQVLHARNRLLDNTAIYGTRLTIDLLEDLLRFPYPPFFANLIVVSGQARGISWSDIYRVLRPCGGMLVCLGETGNELAGLESVGSDDELWEVDGMTVLARGKLPGAFDWNSTVTCDQRVAWPLELLWYGGSGPSRSPDRHGNGMAPIAANGRYFAIGEHGLTAVDAYNGTELWSRTLPYAFKSNKGSALESLAVDDDSIYLNFGSVLYELDAADGEQAAVFGEFEKSETFDLGAPREFDVELDRDHSGHVVLSADTDALTLTLLTDLTAPSKKDSWEIFLDFRPPEKRRGIYGPGVAIFMINIRDTAVKAIPYSYAGYHCKLDLPKPELSLAGNSTNNGTETVCKISRAAINTFAAGTVREFAFAATLQAYSQREKRTKQRHLFGDERSGIINSGWGVFRFEGSDPPPSGAGDKAPLDGSLKDLPAEVLKWARLPVRGADNPYRRWGKPTRSSPLTGDSSSKFYNPAYGCARAIPSATVDFFRSATVAYYDYEHDSGIGNFGGIRAGCGSPGTMMPALGLLISNEGARGCVCSYNYQTSFVLAPAEYPRNEDWAVFHDETLRGAALTSVAINLGAPGDRRDDSRTLWVGYPRSKQIDWNSASHVPFRISANGDLGIYRFSSDRIPVAKTDSPWIYSSGYRGLEHAVLDLAFYNARETLLSHPTLSPPRIDGKLDDPCWDGSALAPFRSRWESAYIRHDDENLYIGYRKRRAVDRLGRSTPITMSATGEDSPVWNDDSIEVYLFDPDNSKVIHFGSSAFGARYDRRWETVFDLPPVESVEIDAEIGDWREQGLRIDLFRKGRCSIGWNKRGVLLYAELPTDFSATKAKLDGLILVTADIGQRKQSFVELAINPSSGTNIVDHRLFLTEKCRRTKEATAAAVFASQTNGTYAIEALIPWSDLNLAPEPGVEIAFPIALYNTATIDPRFRRKGAWRHNEILKDLSLICRLRLVETFSPPCKLIAFPLSEEGDMLETTLSLAGDEDWDGDWSNAATVERDYLSTEMSIPWEDIEESGLSRDNLRVSLVSEGKNGDSPLNLLSAMDKESHVLHLRGEPLREKTYTVRLHFSEPDDVVPGQRVFDVKLQDRTVIKDLDIIRETGTKNTALVKEFKAVKADTAIRVDLPSKSRHHTSQTVPILSGIELLLESD